MDSRCGAEAHHAVSSRPGGLGATAAAPRAIRAILLLRPRLLEHSPACGGAPATDQPTCRVVAPALWWNDVIRVHPGGVVAVQAPVMQYGRSQQQHAGVGSKAEQGSKAAPHTQNAMSDVSCVRFASMRARRHLPGHHME